MTDIAVTHPDRFYIGGEWVTPSSDETIRVVDSTNEEVFLTVAEANDADMSRAVGAAREAFDSGPWPRMSHAERAQYLRAMAAGLRERGADVGQIWPRETGMLHSVAKQTGDVAGAYFDEHADMADTFPFEERVAPTMGGKMGLVLREPVGVVGAIPAFNGALTNISHKVPPALIAGCTVVLKMPPGSPGQGYVLAEVAEAVGLPAGVLNVLTAERQVSESMVRDPRVDKITFTGSSEAGRRIASICADRMARFNLELGGKSAAVILDDMDIATAAATLVGYECFNTGQTCNSMTRIIISRGRHDEMVEALASLFSQIRVGDPFDPTSQMGPLASEQQRARVEGYVAKGKAEGATLATGGGRPAHLDRGFYVEPAVFGNVDNASTIGREEIFGPVLSVIPADNEEHAIALANDSIYGLNSSVFTEDADRAREVAGRLRAGTVGHNAVRGDFGIAFGGYKQSGVGREGGIEGLLPYLETKTVILDDYPTGYAQG